MTISDTNKNGLGRINVETLSLPNFVKPFSATYTRSGTVLVSYKQEDDPADMDYQHIAVVNDDGNDFREIFSGIIRRHKTANGIRFMCFSDNKRILLGDYVLECSPDINSCENAELVPVEYPAELMNDPAIMMHWSEIIIAPDNEHIAWTMLRYSGSNGVVFLGKLSRQKTIYAVLNAQIISNLDSLKEDPERPGWFIPQTMRGGEVKQFVRGGAAISLVGAAGGSVITDSVVQALDSEEMLRITNAPSYDETTIFSPDEKLGLLMSSRFSPKTDPAIFGLLPRSGFALLPLIGVLYMYAVAGVRSFRKGNVGPVLIDIEQSIKDRDYRGVALNDPEEKWVYYSPMSWHPAGKKMMWPEGLRGSKTMRIRIATLEDYTPGAVVPAQKTPEAISYAVKNLSRVRSESGFVEGKIAGKHSGYIKLSLNASSHIAGSAEAVYVDYSDDGKNFYKGFEKSCSSITAETTYEADIVRKGDDPGEMKLHAAFSPGTYDKPPKLLLEKSHGYASYRGFTLNIEDMAE
jgi:hypothetical protein